MHFIRIVLALSLFVPFLSQAIEVPTDLKLSFNMRTYPIGAQVTGTGGLNHLLWGDSDTWKYGYVRLAANLATSAVVNRAGLELQLFPISIFGVSAGYDWGVRNFIPKYLNCNQFECEGRIDRKYLKVTAIAAYHHVIFSGIMKVENLRGVGTVKPFFDENTLLVGRNLGEDVVTYNPALLYTVNEAWKVGVTSLYSRALTTGDYSHLYGPVATWVESPRLNIVGGVGLNRSPVVQSGWCAFALVQFTPAPSLSVSDLAQRIHEKTAPIP